MEDDQIDAEAMASMMGFSSFGDQDRPNKKRRFNPGADAAIGTVKKVSEASTGSNAAPLGERKPAQGANADEIDLEDDDEEASEKATGTTLNVAASSASLPQRPAVPIPGSWGGGHTHGARSDRWYEGYYDVGSNENPWQRLEKDMGLHPRGKWMPKPENPTLEANRT